MASDAEQAVDIRDAEVVTIDDNGQVYRIVQVQSSLEEPVTEAIRDGTKRQTNVWSHQGILQLLEHRIALDRQFVRGPSVKRPLWNKISADMQAAGFEVTAQECHTKWRNLLMTYRKNRDRAARLGEERVVWEYFHIMHPVFMHYAVSERASASDRSAADEPPAKKRALASGTACGDQAPSRQARKSPVTSDVEEYTQDDDDEFYDVDDDTSLLEPYSPEGSAAGNEATDGERLPADDSTPLAWFRNYLQRKAKEDRRREQREERMWNEYRELEERKLEVMAQLTDVLIGLKDKQSAEG